MDALKLQLTKLAERIDEMALRERAMLFIIVMGVLYTFTSVVFFSPLQAEQTRLAKELKSKREQTQAVDKQIQAILEQNLAGNDGTKRTRAAVLQEKLNSLDSSLNGITQGLVSPKEMAHLVEQMLKKNGALEVIKLENLPPAPLLDAKDNAKAASQQIIYKHGLRIQFKGRYSDIVNYLRALEALPWKMFWSEISLKTETYPYSSVTLVVYTLSLQQGWIGV